MHTYINIQSNNIELS